MSYIPSRGKRGGSQGGRGGGNTGRGAGGEVGEGGGSDTAANSASSSTLRNNKNFRADGNHANGPSVPPPGSAQAQQVSTPSNSQALKDFTYDNYIALQNELATVKALLVPMQNAETFEDIKPSVLLDPIMDGLDKADEYLNLLSMSHFGLMDKCVELEKGLKSCVDRMDTYDKGAKKEKVTQRVAKIENTIATNLATKNLSPNFESSKVYDKLCDDTADSNRIVKIPALNLGANLSGAQMAAKVREVIEKETPGLSLTEITNIVSLKKHTTQDEEGKFTVPVLLYTKDKDARYEVESKIKAGNIKETSFHWPPGLVKNVKEIRKQLSKLEDEDLGSFENRQIRIRPSKTGRSLVISYRDTFNDDWVFLESVKTPAPAKMLVEAKGKQPCKSDYFKL